MDFKVATAEQTDLQWLVANLGPRITSIDVTTVVGDTERRIAIYLTEPSPVNAVVKPTFAQGIPR